MQIKRFATLLETMIALVLMSLLLSALLATWAFTSKMRKEVARLEEKSFRELSAGVRLSMLLTSPSSPRETPFAFYTEENALIFTYDNGTGQGPLFSNTVVGKLYVDKESRLSLLTWPSPKIVNEFPIPVRAETLFEGIESLNFSFTLPDNQKVEALPPENKTLPAFITVKIKSKSDELMEYEFFMPSSQVKIVYP